MENSNKAAGMPRLRLPVVVEGRYDKSAILGMFSGVVITTDGFGIFNSKEKQALIRKLAKDGIILLTDSDGGGKQIRSFLSGLVPKEKIYQLYIPRIEGKEKRKAHRGKEGILGVEGVGGEVLRGLLLPFSDESGEGMPVGDITNYDMFSLGLSGADNSAEMRDALCRELALPGKMSAKALLTALNVVSSKAEIEKIVKKITLN